MSIEIIKKDISLIKINPNNPRVIKDYNFKKLVNSIRDFPERSGAQTAEMDKIDGNTKYIYATDRSYRKSFGSILQDPNNAKITINRHNTKRGLLWHHRISWSKICPKILNSEIYRNNDIHL